MIVRQSEVLVVLTDYIVLLLYASGLIGVGLFFATRVKNSSDMFAAGGRSPWWVSGLSGFMTMFSAGTFVVWGGIAYRYGLVAVTISLCYGVAALAVGWTVAGRWRKLGVSSAAEFLELRYGRSLVQLYTWLKGFLLVFLLGGTVYALSAVVTELIILPPELEQGVFGFLRDDGTGQLSEFWTSVVVLAVVVVVTLAGGLWSVLVTDTLQFIVLSVSVVVVVPLILSEVGGLPAFLEGVRGTTVDDRGRTLASPIAWNYTWLFLLGWVIVHYFKIGGEWAFVQRFTCVPSARDARRSAVLFGVMYLVSPLFWMLPAIAYRLIQPLPEGLDAGEINRIAERAYINACLEVLPPGMIGLMVAAMISATASMATTQLNVYAAAFTKEFYHRVINPMASERLLVTMGRLFTVILGGIALAGAIIIPGAEGGYTGFIIMVTSSLAIPLTMPTIWGLLSRRIGLGAAWTATLVGVGASLFAKIVVQSDAAIAFAQSGDGIAAVLGPIITLANENTQVSDWVVGLAAPAVTLVVFELMSRGEDAGWGRAHSLPTAETDTSVAVQASHLPAIMSAWTTAVIGAAMLVLAVVHAEHRATLVVFGLLLGAIGAALLTVPKVFVRRG
ncbi:MAG: Na+:solute symporter [Planctomycetota bacterium]